MNLCHTTCLGVGHLVMLLTLIYYSRTADAAFNFIVRPRDTAVKVGSRVMFNCRVDRNDYKLIWWTWTGNGSYPNIAPSCAVSAGYQSRFAVETTQPDECSLIVTAASLADAATYRCIYRYADGTGRSLTSVAQLFVLGQVSGRVNISDTSIIVDGVGLQYRCSVTFNGAIYPTVSWGPGLSGAHIRNTAQGTGQFSSVLEVTARRPEVPQYTCTIHFRNNRPNYTDQYTFTAIKVFSSIFQNGSDDRNVTATDINSFYSSASTTPTTHTCTCNEDSSDSPKIIIALAVLLGIAVITVVILTVVLCRRDVCSTTSTNSSQRSASNVHEITEDGIGVRPQQTTDDASPYTSLDPITHDTDKRVYAQLRPA